MHHHVLLLLRELRPREPLRAPPLCACHAPPSPRLCCRPQCLPTLKDLKADQMEHILDKFDAREEKHCGEVIIKQGDSVSIWRGGDALWGSHHQTGGLGGYLGGKGEGLRP